MKLYYPDCRVNARQNFYSVCIVQLWNILPEEVVSASAILSRLSIHLSSFTYCVSVVRYLSFIYRIF